MPILTVVALGLVFFGLRAEAAQAAQQPAAPPPKPKPLRPSTAAVRKPAAGSGKTMPASAAKPHAAAKPTPGPVTSTVTAASPEQAAVDAVVKASIVPKGFKDGLRYNTEPVQHAAENSVSPATAAPSIRTPKQAAQALRSFLLLSKRFGTVADRPQQTKDAQREMGVEPDGIVGPKTRAAAKALGVELPPKPAKKK